jgi:hypothetical protein
VVCAPRVWVAFRFLVCMCLVILKLVRRSSVLSNIEIGEQNLPPFVI